MFNDNKDKKDKKDTINSNSVNITSKCLITTAIDYVNDVIHIGHAYQKILADSYARYQRELLGSKNVGFVTGTDEHGQKIFQVSSEKKIEPRVYVDEIASLSKEQQDSLNISYDRFIRTTDEDHKKVAKDFFEKVYKKGYIYKSIYKGLYCVGCEEYKTPKDLIDGRCPNHPNGEIKIMEEENYFFALTKFKDKLLKLYEENKDFVLPAERYNEMRAFINNLEDVAITRTKDKLPWGIDCPVDSNHVIWVWFDALVNYYTFGSQNNLWDEDTSIVHFLGKDNARMHAVLWPAMLMAAELPQPSHIYVNGFLSLNGKKISKSLGNVIKPSDLVEKYGVDAVRYYFLRYGPIVEDSDFSFSSFEETYNGDLSNGLGNTVSRIAKLCERSGFEFPLVDSDGCTCSDSNINFNKDYNNNNVFMCSEFIPMSNFRVDIVLLNIWDRLSKLDKHINDNKPWDIEDKDCLYKVLSYEVCEIRNIAKMLKVFMPDTSDKILDLFGTAVKFESGLFPRLPKLA